MTELKPCPICGAKAFVSHDIVDGYDMGYSAGCPRYCINDGVHGHTDFYMPREDCFSVHGCYSRDAAIKWWNERVARYDKEMEQGVGR